LTWTHYRLLTRVENERARQFYLGEAIEARWSTRQLERQINSFYYERILSGREQIRRLLETLAALGQAEEVRAGGRSAGQTHECHG